jgi:hypothetical protein
MKHFVILSITFDPIEKVLKQLEQVSAIQKQMAISITFHLVKNKKIMH